MMAQTLRAVAQSSGGSFAPDDVSKDLIPNSGATFEQVARYYVAFMEPKWGASAEGTTKSVIRKHLIATLGGRRLAELTATDIQTVIDGMVRGNASSSLLHKAVLQLRAIFDQALELGIIPRNPMRSRSVKIEYGSQKRKSTRYLSLEECRRLLCQLSGRDHLIIRMFIQLGLRPHELFALRRNDVYSEFIRIDEVLHGGWTSGTLEFGGNVYVPPGLMDELRDWLACTSGESEDWLFPASRRKGRPIGQNYYRKRVLRPAAEKAGISLVDLLTLRRTCATHFGQKASITDTHAQLRHADPLNVYEGTIPKSLKRAAVALEAEIQKDAKRAAGTTALAAQAGRSR